MQITPEERGRRLYLIVGGRTPEMDAIEAAEADEDVVRVSVPPVSAKIGARLFSFYTGVTFSRQESFDEIGFRGTPSEAAIYMSRLALSALPLSDEEGGDDAQRRIAEERWQVVQELRFEEAQRVCNAAVFWNVQGGSLTAAEAALHDELLDEDGTPVDALPKAIRVLMRANGLWDASGQWMTLRSSESETPTPSPADTPATSTPSGSSGSSDSGARPRTGSKSSSKRASGRQSTTTATTPSE